jgi:Domain of unknown function (DUF4252)
MMGGHRNVLLAATFLTAVWAASAAAADKDKDKDKAKPRTLTEQEIRALPGYIDVDFARAFGDREAKVEVNLKSPMLELVGKFAEDEDPELPGLFANLRLVRVQVYEVTDAEFARAASMTSDAARKLDAAGWERVVRVREDGDFVDVYFKPSADNQALDGVVVMVVGEDNEAVFVNVVGRIHPEDVHRLGEHFNIDALDSLHADHKRSRH